MFEASPFANAIRHASAVDGIIENALDSIAGTAYPGRNGLMTRADGAFLLVSLWKEEGLGDIPEWLQKMSHRYILVGSHPGQSFPSKAAAVQAWIDGGCIIPRLPNGSSIEVWVERESDGKERMVLGPIQLPNAFAGMSRSDIQSSLAMGKKQTTHASYWAAWLATQ